jgi:hypothetical protein
MGWDIPMYWMDVYSIDVGEEESELQVLLELDMVPMEVESSSEVVRGPLVT